MSIIISFRNLGFVEMVSLCKSLQSEANNSVIPNKVMEIGSVPLLLIRRQCQALESPRRYINFLDKTWKVRVLGPYVSEVMALNGVNK